MLWRRALPPAGNNDNTIDNDNDNDNDNDDQILTIILIIIAIEAITAIMAPPSSACCGAGPSLCNYVTPIILYDII